MKLLPLVALLGAVSPLLSPSGSGATPPVASDLDGVIRPFRVVHVSAATDGLLEDIQVERGDHVEAGQVLGRLVSDVEAADLALARARMDSNNDLETARTRYEEAERKHARLAALLGEGIVTEEEVETARTTMQLETLALQDAREDQQLARLEHERSLARMNQRIVTSPLTGVVIDRYLSAGELVSRSGESRLVTLAQLDPLIVDVNLPAAHYGRVRVGDRARVHVIHPELRELEGVLTVADPVIDTASNTFRARLELANPDGSIPAGLRCKVDFESPHRVENEEKR